MRGARAGGPLLPSLPTSHAAPGGLPGATPDPKFNIPSAAGHRGSHSKGAAQPQREGRGGLPWFADGVGSGGWVCGEQQRVRAAELRARGMGPGLAAAAPTDGQRPGTAPATAEMAALDLKSSLVNFLHDQQCISKTFAASRL